MSEQDYNDNTTGDIYPVAECRACLQILYSDSNLWNIFEPWTPPWDGMGNTIAEDLIRLANIQISETDKHSKVICETCYQSLRGACHFTACVRKNDQILVERYPSESHQNLDKVWPKPIQVDKIIHSSMFQNPMDIEVKQEVLSEDEYATFNGTFDDNKDDNPNLDVKIEPEEIQQATQVNVNGNSEYLISQRKKFNTANIKKDDQKVSVDRGKSKRKIIPKRSWSPEASPPSKKSTLTNTKQPVTNAGTLKKYIKSVQMNESSDSSISSKISSDDSNVTNGSLVQDIDKPFLSEERNIRPSKDDLKNQLEMLITEKNEPTKTANEVSSQTSGTSTLIPRNRNTKEYQHKKLLETKDEIGDIPPKITASEKIKVHKTDTLDSVDEDIENVEQLFPSDYDSGKMKHIGNNIYCRQTIYQSAIGASHKATHLARRLLEGVFTHETLMSCTLTGQAPRSKDKTVNVIMPLNQRAKDAILDFAMKTAVEKKWPLLTRLTILRVMSQKLTEYKRDNKKDKPDVES